MQKENNILSGSLFGTDGIRGRPGRYPLNKKMLLRIATGFADYLNQGNKKKERLKVVIGKDTRLSGEKIQQFLAEAFISRGIDVILAGTITTPGLSYLTRSLSCAMGVVVSASHNKPTDNGIKVFDSRGCKISVEQEKEIERIIFAAAENPLLSKMSASSNRKGKVSLLKDGYQRYLNFLRSTAKGLNLKGFKIAVDCAWGAASPFAKELFVSLGARVYSIHDSPSGHHINKGGALNPEILKRLVVKTNSAMGLALDGDADRGIIIDEEGKVLDGDFILAIMASYFKRHKKLARDTIVTTAMSNFGLRSFLASQNIKTIITDVGDKHVLDALIKHGLNLGGEQSGHIIFRDYSPAPDGLLTALQVLRALKDSGMTLSKLSSCISKFPQVLINVAVREKKPFEQLPLLCAKLDHFNRQLADSGRILLRYSGTESLARVMVEGKDKKTITEIAQVLAEHIRQEIGA